MTALAVALVLCCAMVCGTVLALVRSVMAHRTASRAVDASFQAAQDEVRELVAEANRKWDAYCAKADRLSTEVEQLRASSAFRSIS